MQVKPSEGSESFDLYFIILIKEPFYFYLLMIYNFSDKNDLIDHYGIRLEIRKVQVSKIYPRQM